MGLFGSIGSFFKSAERDVGKVVKKAGKIATSVGKEALTGVEDVGKEALKLAPEALQIAGDVEDPAGALEGLVGGSPGEAAEAVGVPRAAVEAALPSGIRPPARPSPQAEAGAQAEIDDAKTAQNVADDTSQSIQDAGKAASSKDQLEQIKKLFPGNDPTSIQMRAALAQQALTG